MYRLVAAALVSVLAISAGCTQAPAPPPTPAVVCEFEGYVVSEDGGACVVPTPTPSPTPSPTPTPTLTPTPTPTPKPTSTPTPSLTPTPTPTPIPVGVGPSPIAAGGSHTCGIQADGKAICWGDDYAGQSSPREGRFVSISAGFSNACALRADGNPVCWGYIDNPDEKHRFIFLDLGIYGGENCGIRIDGSAFCWDRTASIVPTGKLMTISSGSSHGCALRTNGVAVCWGDEDAQQDRPDKAEQYTAIGAGDDYTCALRTDDSPVCWGLDNKWKNAAPSRERFAFLSVGTYFTCGLRRNGTAVCWDEDGVIPADHHNHLRPPQGVRFTHISIGSLHVCGVMVDGRPVCWGRNDEGESAPPRGVRLAIRSGVQPTTSSLIPEHVARSVVRVEVPLREYSSSAGTGVLVDTDTYTGTARLLTAYHVVDERPLGSITVTAEDESSIKEYDAKVVDYDPTKDIALLSICCSSTFPVAKLSERLPEIGELVFAIGYGEYDEAPTTYRGRIIGIRGGSLGTDAALVEGNSGGPLISGQTGEIVGINLAISVEPDSYEWRYVLDDAQRDVLRESLGIWPNGTGIALSSPDIIATLLQHSS